MRWFTWIWAGWVGFGIAFEVAVLVMGIDGATLSEQVWKLREQRSGFFSLLIFFLAWMIYHFIRENVGIPDVPAPSPFPPPSDSP